MMEKKPSDVNLKSLVAVWATLARNIGVSNKSLSSLLKRDSDFIQLYTIDLPALGKLFDSSLDYGYVRFDGSPFRVNKVTKVPYFFQELFSKVFLPSGSIMDRPCYKTIRDIRQLLFMYYKYEVPFSPAVTQESYNKFVELDNTVKEEFSLDEISAIRARFLALLPDINDLDLVGTHSKGATADGYSHCKRRDVVRVSKIHSNFPISEFYYNTQAHYDYIASTSDNRNKSSILMSKLTLVPKDSRGPRIICMEPHEHMFMQQPIMNSLYEFIESSSIASGFINFRDQGVNQKLTYLSSIDRSLATIDLKDASDMVSYALIQKLLSSNYEWASLLDSTRSAFVQVGDLVHKLKKFAPMGSALCFPIEAALFWSIARTATEKCWVYGDDIICPIQDVNAVMSALEKYGLRVNHDKSLYRGYFRESCGAFYYKGHDISIVKLTSTSLDTFVSFINQISERYGDQLANSLLHIFEETMNVIVERQPYSNRDRPTDGVFYTHNWHPLLVFFKTRYNTDLQRTEFLVKRTKTTRSKVAMQPWNAFFNWLTEKEKNLSEELVQYSHTGDAIPYRPDWRGIQPLVIGGKPIKRFTWVHIHNVEVSVK